MSQESSLVQNWLYPLLTLCCQVIVAKLLDRCYFNLAHALLLIVAVDSREMFKSTSGITTTEKKGKVSVRTKFCTLYNIGNAK